MPALALGLGASLASLRRLGRVWDAFLSRASKDTVEVEAFRNRGSVLVLQFLVGGIVTFGGYAFATFALNGFASSLGWVHFGLGMAGLAAGVFAATRKSAPAGVLLLVNVATIAYSFASEALIESQPLLPAGAAFDSLIGTAVAVVLSAAVVIMLRS